MRINHLGALAIVFLLTIPAQAASRVCTAAGRCAPIASSAKSAFAALFRDLEAAGWNLGSPGCLASGHMPGSKHHTGNACDLFDQISRNRTLLRQPGPAAQIAFAARHGLTSGCAWVNRDCGHFEIPGGYARHYRRGHRYRVARR